MKTHIIIENLTGYRLAAKLNDMTVKHFKNYAKNHIIDRYMDSLISLGFTLEQVAHDFESVGWLQDAQATPALEAHWAAEIEALDESDWLGLNLDKATITVTN